MFTVALAVLVVLAILYLTPLVFYGVGSRFIEMPSPDRVGPQRFLLGILVTKLGTAIAFVVLFWLSRAVWAARWLLYSLVWFIMFAASELGDRISGRATAPEALLGVFSEAVYAPLSAWTVAALLK
jgi:hypothetical protein